MNIENMLDSNKFGVNLLIFHTSYKRFVNVELKQYDLNLIQAICLSLIDKETDINQKKLADMLFLTKGAITKAVNKLVDMELVCREKSGSDKRHYVLNTSEKGKTLLKSLNEIHTRWEEEMGLADLSENFEDTFKKLALKSTELI